MLAVVEVETVSIILLHLDLEILDDGLLIKWNDFDLNCNQLEALKWMELLIY